MIVADALKFGIDPLAWTILPRIELGPLAVSPHGIGIALGYLLGAQAMVRRARRLGGPDEALLWSALFWALFGAIAGARIGYVLGHLSQVTDGGRDPLGVLKVYEGGISLLGGITGGIVAAEFLLGFHQVLQEAPQLGPHVVAGSHFPQGDPQ